MAPRRTQRLINSAIVLGSLLPYLEWGGGNAAFLGQMEYTLLFGASTSSDTFQHPMVVLPLAGQVLVLFALFQHTPSRRITTIGVTLLSVLIGLVVIGGALMLNGWMLLSTLPFVAAVAWHFIAARAGLQQASTAADNPSR